MAVRKVSNRGGNIIGHFPSLKMHRMIAFESLIELDYLYLLDYESVVEWIAEQPLTLEYPVGTKVLHYTPDFHVIRARLNALIECKPVALVDAPENQRKFAAARAWCAERRWEFQVITDQQIRAGFCLRNIKMLTRYARHSVEPWTKGRIYAILESTPLPMKVSDLARALSPGHPAAAFAPVFRMVFYHELSIPLDEALISGDSRVSLPAPQQKEQT